MCGNLARIIACLGVAAVLLAFLISPVYSQTGIDQTFTWTANASVSGFNRVDSPWYIVPVTFTTVHLQSFEVTVRIYNDGPTVYSFDLYAQFETPPPPYHTYAIIPSVYATNTSIVQRVTVNNVVPGFTSLISFSVHFTKRDYSLEPGVSVADIGGIDYTDNVLSVDSGSFGASFGLEGDANGHLSIGPISTIRVVGQTSGRPIPEFETTPLVLAISALTTIIFLSQTRKTKGPGNCQLVFTNSKNVRASSKPSA